jgi:hypothetical protein
MKPREPNKKLMTLDDLARFLFEELDLELSNFIWIDNSNELNNSFIGILLGYYQFFYCYHNNT